MDITNLNFLESLTEITETIAKCDFIAIDTELSGLLRERNNNIFDLPEERFAKAVESSRGYFIMQFGLSCFTRLAARQYSNRTYNFYIFPQANGDHGDVDRTFSLQSHAIQFLTKHGFDFNKLFKHGVSYLTFQEKKALTVQLKSETKARSKVELGQNGLPKFVPAAMASHCREWLTKVKNFVEQRKEEGTEASSNSSTSKGDNRDGEMTETVGRYREMDRLDLRDCSTNHKRSVMKRLLEFQPFYENIEIDNCVGSDRNDMHLVITYIDKTAKEDKQRKGLIAAKGFLEVLESVILNKKPIVGHNLALDLIQMINQFVEPLTDDYHSFKEICHSLFPQIYDTKFIAHSILEPETLTNNQSRLSDLYCQLKDSNTLSKVQVSHLDEFHDENQLPHQAGYDAYMSGYCFLVLCESHMKEKKKYKYKREDLNSKPVSIAQEQQIVNDFCNKVYLSYSYDFKYFNLSEDEEEPDRSHIFYVDFPQTWCLDDLFQAFQQYGGVTVSRLSKTSALCALRDPKHVDAVLKKAKKLRDSGSNHKIFSYDSYLDNIKPKKKNKPDSYSEDVEFDYG